MGSIKTLASIVAGLLTTFSSPAVAQEASNQVTLTQPVPKKSLSLGVVTYGYFYNAGNILDTAAQEISGRVDASDLTKKVKPIPVGESGLALKYPITNPIPVASGVTSQLYTGFLFTMASTELPGSSLDQSGTAILRAKIRVGKADAMLPINAKYDFSGDLTAFQGLGTLGGKVLWYHHDNTFRVGSQLEFGLGGRVMWGDADFTAGYKHGDTLAEGSFSTINGGLSGVVIVSPVIVQLYSAVECIPGLGGRIDKTWGNIDGYVENDDTLNPFTTDFDFTSYANLLNFGCFYDFGK